MTRPSILSRKAAVVALTLLAAPLSFARPARAENATCREAFALDFDAPSSCPSYEAFLDAVQARLGCQPFIREGDVEDDLVLTVRIEEQGSVLRGEVGWQGDAAPRALEGELGMCADLVDALAFSAAILFAPEALARRGRDVSRGDRRAEEGVAPTDTLRSASFSLPMGTEDEHPPSWNAPTSPRPERDVSLRPAAAFGLTYGQVPEMGGAPRLEVALQIGELAVRAWGELGLPLVDVEHQGAELDLLEVSGGLGGCYLPSPLRLCVIGGGGALQGSIAGGDLGTAAVGFAGAGVSYELQFGSFFPRLEAEVALHAARPSVHVGSDVVWRAPPARVRLAIVLEARFSLTGSDSESQASAEGQRNP